LIPVLLFPSPSNINRNKKKQKKTKKNKNKPSTLETRGLQRMKKEPSFHSQLDEAYGLSPGFPNLDKNKIKTPGDAATDPTGKKLEIP